jgi:hypothetical protein
MYSRQWEHSEWSESLLGSTLSGFLLKRLRHFIRTLRTRATREKPNCSPVVRAPGPLRCRREPRASFLRRHVGFEKSWHEGDGAGKVCQVNRGECEVILCEDATRRDKVRLFVELTADGLTDLRRELVERSVPSKESWWGYDVLQIDDPDGNELLFPY